MVNPPLTAEETRRLTAGWADPDYRPAEKQTEQTPNYRTGDEWARNIEKMKTHGSLIYAMAMRGNTVVEIAAVFGVTRECVARRLRPAGFLNPPGRRGRPKKP